MSSFTDAAWVKTDLRDARGNRLYRITPGLTFYIGYAGSGLEVEVKDGTLTDGPSWPHWLKDLARILHQGWMIRSMLKASAVHDELRGDLRFAKLEGDALFLVAMNAEGTPGLLKWLGFLGVLLNNSRGEASPRS